MIMGPLLPQLRHSSGDQNPLPPVICLFYLGCRGNLPYRGAPPDEWACDVVPSMLYSIAGPLLEVAAGPFLCPVRASRLERKKSQNWNENVAEIRISMGTTRLLLGVNFGPEKNILPPPQFPTDTLQTPRPPPPPLSLENPRPPPSWDFQRKKTDPRPFPGASDSPFPSPEQENIRNHPPSPGQKLRGTTVHPEIFTN